jgi:hypothetical protein
MTLTEVIELMPKDNWQLTLNPFTGLVIRRNLYECPISSIGNTTCDNAASMASEYRIPSDLFDDVVNAADNIAGHKKEIRQALLKHFSLTD